MRWVEASERLPIYEPKDYNLKINNKALHGYYNGHGLFITHEGHYHINDVEWLDEEENMSDFLNSKGEDDYGLLETEQPEASEDEWNEVADIYNEAISNPFGSQESVIEQLKSKFTIRRKQ